MCEVVAMPELLGDARFASTTLRAQNQEALRDLLVERFAGANAGAWLAKFRDAGVPGAPINGYAEALADPQSVALGLVQPVALPGGRETSTVGCPVRLDGKAVPVSKRYPALGEDTAALRERVEGRR